MGVVLYGGLWLMLPVRDQEQLAAEDPPGVSAATRRGLRTIMVAPQRRRDAAVVVSLLVCLVGVVALLQALGLGLSTQIFWPALVGSGGVVLLWWQADETSRYSWLHHLGGLEDLAAHPDRRGAARRAPCVSAIFQSGVRGSLATTLATLVLAAIGAALVLGPWLLRTNRALRFERAERIRTQERADVAAHLHDSVLQTLALIQRQAGDPQAVSQLARTQERELRRWLFEPADREGLLLGTALKDAAAEVEDAHGVVVELVMVGDCPVGEEFPPLVAATREALLNAAKHSGVQRVDLYGEVGAEGVEIFVRDRGSGFDPAAVPADRLGVRGSIVDRMLRHGGRADVRSQPGDGTEVRLWMPAHPKDRSEATGDLAWLSRCASWSSTTTPCSGPVSRPSSPPRSRSSARQPTSTRR